MKMKFSKFVGYLLLGIVVLVVAAWKILSTKSGALHHEIVIGKRALNSGWVK